MDTAARSARANDLKTGLNDVVGVRPGFDDHVQGEVRVVGQRAQKLLGQLGVEVADQARRAARRRRTRRTDGRRCRCLWWREPRPSGSSPSRNG